MKKEIIIYALAGMFALSLMVNAAATTMFGLAVKDAVIRACERPVQVEVAITPDIKVAVPPSEAAPPASTPMPFSSPSHPVPSPIPTIAAGVEKMEEANVTVNVGNTTIRVHRLVWREGELEVIIEEESTSLAGSEPFFYAPVLVDGEGKSYRFIGSLDELSIARLRGEKELTLRFEKPPEDAELVLVFNPSSGPENAVAPRVEVKLRQGGER